MTAKMKLMGLALVIGFAVLAPFVARGEDKPFALTPTTTLREALTEQTGKRVALQLDSGQEVEGTITLVGFNLVHVSRLTGKEFYDAVVSLDKISAVRFRARER